MTSLLTSIRNLVNTRATNLVADVQRPHRSLAATICSGRSVYSKFNLSKVFFSVFTSPYRKTFTLALLALGSPDLRSELPPYLKMASRQSSTELELKRTQ
jgi:hypothetical protein